MQSVGRNNTDILRDPLRNKGSAFTHAERVALGIDGLLPPGIADQAAQAERIYASIEALNEPLAKYVEMSALQDRNEHLFYRVLMDHLEALMPIVYTPTVGTATQRFSHVFRRGRGVWITPDHAGRVRDVLAACVGERDVRLLVVTDNESILGIGDQGAGGMAISIGKLALYTACAGIHPAQTLPVSLDVGTDNRALLQDPLYLGWPSSRLRGAAYDALVDELVDAVRALWPHALLQWEDFRKDNALAILERHRDRVLSFNDDIQGTGAVALAGVMSALRIAGTPLQAQRFLIYGAGAAGLGIARQVRAALELAGVEGDDVYRRLAVLDSRGLLVEGRKIADDYKRELAWPRTVADEVGVGDGSVSDMVNCFAPSVLIGTSGQAGGFDRSIIERMASATERPIVLPLSNPTDRAEAQPADVIAWSQGRALVAAGSPFAPVHHDGREIRIGQGNNVFIFPALGLAALESGAATVSDRMITEASRALADAVTDAELESGLLFPEVGRLRAVTAYVAERVAGRSVLDAMWTPDYPSYV